MENVAISLAQESGIKKLFYQFLKFALVGVTNTAIDLAILNMEMLITEAREGTAYAVEKGFSFMAAVAFSYFLNKYWTFRDTSKEQRSKKIFRFVLISVVGMGVNVGTATVVVTYLKALINPSLDLSFLGDQLWGNLGALCGTAVGLIWNFLGYKFWVFDK